MMMTYEGTVRIYTRNNTIGRLGDAPLDFPFESTILKLPCLKQAREPHRT